MHIEIVDLPIRIEDCYFPYSYAIVYQRVSLPNKAPADKAEALAGHCRVGPKRKCWMTGNFPKTSALHIFTIPPNLGITAQDVASVVGIHRLHMDCWRIRDNSAACVRCQSGTLWQLETEPWTPLDAHGCFLLHGLGRDGTRCATEVISYSIRDVSWNGAPFFASKTWTNLIWSTRSTCLVVPGIKFKCVWDSL